MWCSFPILFPRMPRHRDPLSIIRRTILQIRHSTPRKLRDTPSGLYLPWKKAQAKMQKTWRIVILEDRPEDARLVQDELRKGGLVFTFDRVQTRQQFVQELQTRKPDLILSDHGLPSFDGFAALQFVKKDI